MKTMKNMTTCGGYDFITLYRYSKDFHGCDRMVAIVETYDKVSGDWN
jgi:hypothetical protein